MALEMKQSLAQRQELRMTPQLQQAIRLLQLSRQELVDVVANELIENPMLEEDAERAESPESAQKRSEDEQRRALEEGVADRARDDSEERTVKEATDDIDWAAYLENYSSPLPATSSGGGDDLPGYEQTLTRGENLVDHLLVQLGVAECQTIERDVAEVLIGNLDEQGYLRDLTLEEVAEQEDVPLDTVEEALMIVQELDPLGVGARDLAECLLIQARQLYPEDKVTQRVIAEALHDLERKDYAGIARQLKVTKAEVIEAHRRIMTLDPRPGSRFSDSEPTYITPDIYIVRRDDEWVAVLNDDGLPKLRVSNYYRRALKSSSADGAKDYVQERLRSAMWLIRSIEQRQKTIVKVTESIIRFQRDFFEYGIDHLRPLVLREVADDIGMHESTISRVTTNKYVHTPRGIYELKFFFNSSIRKDSGDDIAAEAVKQRIRKIVESEDRRRPFSDQKLVEILLEEHGIDIARRTVAKYREMLGILSSSKRKQLI